MAQALSSHRVKSYVLVRRAHLGESALGHQEVMNTVPLAFSTRKTRPQLREQVQERKESLVFSPSPPLPLHLSLPPSFFPTAVLWPCVCGKVVVEEGGGGGCVWVEYSMCHSPRGLGCGGWWGFE